MLITREHRWKKGQSEKEWGFYLPFSIRMLVLVEEFGPIDFYKFTVHVLMN